MTDCDPSSPSVAICPMDGLLRTLMGPWTTYVIWLLQSHGPLRFGALKAQIPNISSKVLTDRLRHLETAGLVHRDYQPTIPPQVTYSLTARGHELKGVLAELAEVAERWRTEDAAVAASTSAGASPAVAPE